MLSQVLDAELLNISDKSAIVEVYVAGGVYDGEWDLGQRHGNGTTTVTPERN